jgi:acetamidase/formamidase
MSNHSTNSHGASPASSQKTTVEASSTRSTPSRMSNNPHITCYTHTNTNTPPSAKAIWDFEGIFCSSRHIPGVRFAGLIHPGILGCAPSAEVLETWNKREGELISTHTHLNRTVAEPPQPKNVHAGSATGELKEKIGQEGARTIPGRPEHGESALHLYLPTE